MSQRTGLFVPKQRVTAQATTVISQQSTQAKDRVVNKVARPFHAALKAPAPADDSPTDSQSECSDTKPETVLNPKVTVYHEVESLDSSSDNKIWSIVEITGDLYSDAEAKTERPLNIIAILDCSTYTSDYGLADATQIIHALCQLLSHDHDRLAVVASPHQHRAGHYLASHVIRSLKRPDADEIEASLKTVVQNRALNAPVNHDLSETLVAASHLLEHLENSKQNLNLNACVGGGTPSLDGQDNASAVILLSSNPSIFCNVLEHPFPVPLHVIKLGMIHWSCSQFKYTGWELSTSCLQVKGSSVRGELKRLIGSTRRQSDFSPLTRLEINVEAAAGCRIDRLVGCQKLECLRPGQTVSLGVRTAVPRWNRPVNQGESRSTRNDALIAELESILGVAAQDLFSVRVSYSHSKPNPDHVNVQRYTSAIGRHDPHSDWLGYSMLELTRSQDLSRLLIYKELLHLVVQSFPLQVVANVIDDIQMMRKLSSEAEAAKLFVQRELQYQTSVASTSVAVPLAEHSNVQNAENQKENNKSQRGSMTTNGSKMHLTTPNQIQLLNGASQSGSLRVNSNVNITGSPQLGELASDGSGSSNATTIHHDVSENGIDVPDKARAIWKLIRRDSKSKRQLRREQSHRAACSTWSTGDRDRLQKLEHLRCQALLSKRSIGSETLRSLSLGSDPKLLDQHAPWL